MRKIVTIVPDLYRMGSKLLLLIIAAVVVLPLFHNLQEDWNLLQIPEVSVWQKHKARVMAYQLMISEWWSPEQGYKALKSLSYICLVENISD